MQVRCIWCNRRVRYEELDDHIQRHNSIDYILKNQDKVNRDFNVEELWSMGRYEFNGTYWDFINDLFVVLGECDERERLEKYILGIRKNTK